jgi:hypothetical protein
MNGHSYKNGGKPKVGDVVRWNGQSVGFVVAVQRSEHVTAVCIRQGHDEVRQFVEVCDRGKVTFPTAKKKRVKVKKI